MLARGARSNLKHIINPTFCLYQRLHLTGQYVGPKADRQQYWYFYILVSKFSACSASAIFEILAIHECTVKHLARSSRFIDSAKRWDDGGAIKPVFFYARRAAACLKLDGVIRPKTEGHSEEDDGGGHRSRVNFQISACDHMI